MRIFLFVLSVFCLLIAAHRFTLADHSGQYKGALFFLLIGIQLLITAAIIHDHRENRASKSSIKTDKGDSREAGVSVVNLSEEQGKKP